MKEYCSILNHFINKLVSMYCKITMKVKWTDNMQEAGHLVWRIIFPWWKRENTNLFKLFVVNLLFYFIFEQRNCSYIYIHWRIYMTFEILFYNTCILINHGLPIDWTNNGFEISFYLISPPKWYHDFIKNRTIHQLGTKCRKNPQRYRLHTEFKQFHKNTKIIFNIFGNFL